MKVLKQPKETILIVEDDLVVAKDLKNILEGAGYEIVAIADNGKEAIEVAKKLKPDLVLMDIVLKGKMDGIEAAKQIRQHLDIPAVFVTGYVDRDKIERAKLVNPLGYVLKPVEKKSLFANVTMALHRHSLDRQLKVSQENLVRSDASLIKLNRVYKMLSECNQALVHSENESDFLKAICNIIVETGEYKMAWIGFAEHDKEKTVRPVAQQGAGKDYLNKIKITWADNKWGHGPTGTAIRTAKFSINKNFKANPKVLPWRAQALKHGYLSSIVFPLLGEDGKAFGALNIYSAELDAFDPDAVQLLNELANDLAFGILNLRNHIEQKKAENAIRMNEALLEEAQRVGHFGHFDWDARTDAIIWSDEYYRIFGLDLGQKPPGYKKHLKLYTPESAARLDSAVKRSMKTGESYVVDLESLHSDGTTTWITARGEVKRDENHKIIGLRGTAHNITDRKRAENTLEESETRYRLIANNSSDLIWTATFGDAAKILRLFKKKGKKALPQIQRLCRLQTTYVSPAVKKMYGFTQEAYLKRDVSTSMTPVSYRHSMEVLLEELLIEASGKGDPDRKRVFSVEEYRKNGSIIPIEMSVSFLRDAQGRPIGMMGVSRDITERRLAEKALEMREDEFRDLFEASNDAILILDHEKFIDCNKATLKMFGYPTKAKFLEKGPKGVSPYRQPDGRLSGLGTKRHILQAFAENYNFFEWTCQRLNGTLFLASILLSPVFYKGSTVIQATIRDITEQKKQEELLRDSENKFKVLVESSPDCIKLLDAQGRTLYLSPGGLKEHNLKPSQVAKWHIRDTISEKDLPLFDEKFKKALKGEVGTFEVEHRSGTANREWCNVTLTPVRDKNGKITRVFGVSRDISAIRKGTQEYRSLFENILNGYAYCKMIFRKGQPEDFIYLTTNSAFEKLTGLKNVVGKKITEVIPGIRKTNPELFKIYGRVSMTGKSERFEMYSPAFGGWLDVFVYSPKKGYFVAVFENITERKKAEEALLKFKLAIQQSADAIFIADITGSILFVNPAFIKLYGYTEKEILGKNPRVWKTDRYDQNFYKNFWKTILSGKTISAEFTNKTKFGKPILMASTVSPIMNADGKLIGFLATQRDITHQKAIDEKLKTSEAQYRDIVENSPEMIHSVDRNDKLIFVNRKECELLGYTKEEMIGMHMCKVYGDMFCKIVKKGFETLKRTGALFVPDGAMFKKNGEKIDVEIDSIAIYDSKGQFLHTRSIIRDVTEQHRSAKTLKEKVEQMEFMNRLNLKRYKKMMDQQKEIIQLKERLKEKPPTLKEIRQLFLKKKHDH